MSNKVDELTTQIATRIRAERERRGWSLADLAGRCDVSKAMLSKIERGEASPTAGVLLRIATAFGLTLAEMLTLPDAKPQRLLRAADQPQWQDPSSHYIRRQVFQSAENPMELVEVQLPARARVALPASSYARIRQVVWLLSGTLELRCGSETFTLKGGDRLEFGPPSDTQFRNPGDKACRYLVAVLRQ